MVPTGNTVITMVFNPNAGVETVTTASDPLAQRTRVRRRRLTIIGAAGLIAALAIAGVWGLRRYRLSQRDVTPYTVIVDRQVLAGAVIASGNVQPIRQVNLSPYEAGVVASMVVDEGDYIKEGDLLAVMEAGGLDSRLKGRQAQLQEAQVQLALSKGELERYQPLAAVGALSPLDLDKLESRYHASQAAVSAAQQQLEQLRQEQGRLVIHAPFDGVVMERFAESGAYVTPFVTASNTTGATRASLMAVGSGHQVVSSVPESDIGRIYPGQSATVILDAFPSRELHALVRRVSPRASLTTNVTAFDVYLDMQPPVDPSIRYGMSGDVRFAIKDLPETTVVPTVAIATQVGQPGVYVVGRHQQPRFQPVALGLSSGRNTQILDGVEAGEQVFVDWPPWVRQQRQ